MGEWSDVLTTPPTRSQLRAEIRDLTSSLADEKQRAEAAEGQRDEALRLLMWIRTAGVAPLIAERIDELGAAQAEKINDA